MNWMQYLKLEMQLRLFERVKLKRLVLFGALILIAIWQLSFVPGGRHLTNLYKNGASTGIQEGTDKFFYFYYHLGLFPVYSSQAVQGDSKEEAREIIEHHGDTLYMEYHHVVRAGDLGRIWTFLPKALFTGSTKNLSVLQTHIALFVFALLALFYSFWRQGYGALGLILIIFLGSNPFQLYEVYGNENVFSWPISVACLLLAFHLPLILGSEKKKNFRPYYKWALPIATGLFLATVRQIRAEPAAMILGVTFVYLTVSGERWRNRFGLTLLLGLFYWSGAHFWQHYFDAKYEKAVQTVQAAGGDLYTGPREFNHSHWHPIFCGLGDFDKKYGYDWNDPVGYAYARPFMEAKLGVKLPDMDGCCATKVFYDAQKHYYMRPYEMPIYDVVLREKILHDITHDPLWYAGILWNRFKRNLRELPPPSLTIRQGTLPIPIRAWVFLMFFFALVALKRWELVKLVVFTVPLGATSMLVYSYGGLSFYNIWHLVTAAIMVAVLLEVALSYGLILKGRT